MVASSEKASCMHRKKKANCVGAPVIGHWFHLSSNIKSVDEVVLDPHKSTGDNRSFWESEIPLRVCVSDTVFGCVAAMMSCFEYNSQDFHIYVTKTEKTAYKCEDSDVLDKHFTNEHWILDPTEFIYVGHFSYNLCLRLGRKQNSKKKVTCGAAGRLLTSQHLHAKWIARLFEREGLSMLNRPWDRDMLRKASKAPLRLDIEGSHRKFRIVQKGDHEK